MDPFCEGTAIRMESDAVSRIRSQWEDQSRNPSVSCSPIPAALVPQLTETIVHRSLILSPIAAALSDQRSRYWDSECNVAIAVADWVVADRHYL
jgi:hypothetical protein